MKLEGDFMGFYRFLQALERQPRIMRIHKMELEKMTGKDVSEGQIKAGETVSPDQTRPYGCSVKYKR